jgi:hypothetical protein
MRKIKALIYALLGGMIAWGYWQRGDAGWAIFISLFTLVIMALTLSSIGRLKISWGEEGISLAAFPKKPQLLLWQDLEKISLDHLGYHVRARNGRFKIRKNVMPDDLLRRIKENIRINAKAYK